jgi:hypothetical protein
MPPGDPKSTHGSARNWGRRAAWFVGLWLAGVAVVFTVAYAIRLMIL